MPGRKSISIGCLADHAGFHLRLAQLAVFRQFESAMGELALSPAVFSVLEVLDRNPGITQSRLATAVRLDRSSMVPLLDKLGKRGLVERRASTTDRRHNHLFLTPAGESLLAEARRRAARHETEICAGFSAAEKKKLIDLLSRFGG